MSIQRKYNQEKIIISNEILIATGRAPNVDLDLENANVNYDEKGVKVNEYLQTSNENIYEGRPQPELIQQLKELDLYYIIYCIKNVY